VSHDPDHAPFQGGLSSSLELAMVKLLTKFEVSISNSYKDKKCKAKCKDGWFW